MKGWLLVLLMVALLVAAIFAAMNGVFFAWLSVFPKKHAELRVLEIKVWVSWIAAVILLIADIWLVVHTVRQINRRDRMSSRLND
jgi:membrane protein implicated in regulation of membrane protease activity